MRVVKRAELQLGETAIEDIVFDQKSRDDLPRLLMGLQYIYKNKNIRDEIFAILETLISEKSKNNGRPGMELWNIFVLGVVRLNLNYDYDRLQDQANCHLMLRYMLGHSSVFNRDRYELQTIKDNVSLLTEEILDKVNQVIVKVGHNLLKKSPKIH